MTLRHMRILVAVFQQGSVTKAAQALHLAQPSVSLALRELEDYYGVALFTRTGRQLLPTVCGQSFYDYAVHVVSLVDEMETQMRNWDTLGTVRIGSTITIGTHLLPGLVRQLQTEFPDLKIEVKVCRASQVEQLILDNDIDLGLMEMQPEHPKLYAEPFLHDELQAIVPPQHALAARENVTFAELAGYPFLMREPGSAGRKIVEACLALNHLPCSRSSWSSGTRGRAASSCCRSANRFADTCMGSIMKRSIFPKACAAFWSCVRRLERRRRWGRRPGG